MRELLKYQFITLSRFRISQFQFLPEYLGLLFALLVFTIILLGVSSEEQLSYDNDKFINYTYIFIYFLVMPIFLESFMKKSYMPNYRYLKLLFPFSLTKMVFIDILFELFSFKLFILFFYLVLVIPFSIVYEVHFIGKPLSVLGMVLVILIYMNSCLLILTIKSFMKSRALKFYSNFLKLFVIVFFVMYFIFNNINLMKYDTLEVFKNLISILSIAFFVLFVLIYMINLKYDKV